MADTLFAKEIEVERVDWMNEVARKRYGMPERWRWFISEVKNHSLPSAFIMLTGAVCDVNYERGPRKGSPNWAKRDKATEAVVPVRFDDISEIKAEWEAETGKCSNCQGDGKSWLGWNKDQGHRYVACKPCSGTGRPHLRTQPAGSPASHPATGDQS